MKKIILVVLMAVIIVTPCFADEVAPQGLFTINNTLWKMPCEGYSCKIPSYIGFSDNSIFIYSLGTLINCSQPIIISFGIVCFYNASCNIFGDINIQVSGLASSILGIGINRTLLEYPSSSPDVGIGTIKKIESNWDPTDVSNLTY